MGNAISAGGVFTGLAGRQRMLWGEAGVVQMADGIDRVMRHLDMIAGPVPAVPQDRPQIVIMWVPVAGGLWYPAKGLSDPVEAGEPLGTIRDVFGAICETIVSKHDGFVLYRLSSLAVNAGEALLMGVAAPVGTSPGADAIAGGQ